MKTPNPWLVRSISFHINQKKKINGLSNLSKDFSF